MKSGSEITGESAPETPVAFGLNRRHFLTGVAGSAIIAGVDRPRLLAQATGTAVNLARVALPSSFVTTSENRISALNDGALPQARATARVADTPFGSTRTR